MEHYIGLIQDGLSESLIHWLMKVPPMKANTRYTLEAILFFCDPHNGVGEVRIDELHKKVACTFTKRTLIRHIEILWRSDLVILMGNGIGPEISFFLNDYDFKQDPLLEKLEKQSYEAYQKDVYGHQNFY